MLLLAMLVALLLPVMVKGEDSAPVPAPDVGSSVGGGGASASADTVWTGTQTFIDNKWLLQDNVDATKKAAFQLSGITAGQTRTYTLLDANGTIPLLDPTGGVTSQTFLVNTTFAAQSLSVANGSVLHIGAWPGSAFLQRDSGQTVPSLIVSPTQASNSIIVGQFGSAAWNAAHPLQANPTLFIHSANQSTTQWMGLTHNAFSAEITSGTGNLMLPVTLYVGKDLGSSVVQMGNGYTAIGRNDQPAYALYQRLELVGSYGAKNAGVQLSVSNVYAYPRMYIPTIANVINDTTPTGIVRLDLLDADSIGGGLLIYTIAATSGANRQSRSGSIPFSIINVAGAETCAFGSASDVLAGAGTLTVAFDCDTSPTNGVIIRANADTSLNVAMSVAWQVFINSSDATGGLSQVVRVLQP